MKGKLLTFIYMLIPSLSLADVYICQADASGLMVADGSIQIDDGLLGPKIWQIDPEQGIKSISNFGRALVANAPAELQGVFTNDYLGGCEWHAHLGSQTLGCVSNGAIRVINLFMGVENTQNLYPFSYSITSEDSVGFSKGFCQKLEL